MSLGLLIIRLVPGAFVTAHGVQRLARLWGGGGLDELAGLTRWWNPAVSATVTVVGIGIGIGSALLLRIALHRDTSAVMSKTPHPTGRPA